jgi:cobalt/nickel transport system ATP-binding protein
VSILESRRLSHRYPNEVAALRGVDFELTEGSRTVLTGPNGSGKTTLLLHLNGALKPSSGSVFLRGEEMGYSRDELTRWRRQVGFVFQNPDDQLFAPTVAQDVSFGPLNLGLSDSEARYRSDWAMERLSISSLAERAPHELSYGQKKRVAVAGVIAMKPDVLLLDEPTAGLDETSRAALLETLASLNESGTTLLAATHDEKLARDWGHFTVALDEGRVSGVSRTVTASLATKRMVHAQMAVCLGCCCGRVDKGKPEVPVDRLKSAWKENKLLKFVQLSISGCLGPCDVPNVVKISSARGQEWIGDIKDPAEYELLIDWAKRVKAEDSLLPLPAPFDGRRFDPFR